MCKFVVWYSTPRLTCHSLKVHNFSTFDIMELKFHTQLDKGCHIFCLKILHCCVLPFLKYNLNTPHVFRRHSLWPKMNQLPLDVSSVINGRNHYNGNVNGKIFLTCQTLIQLEAACFDDFVHIFCPGLLVKHTN